MQRDSTWVGLLGAAALGLAIGCSDPPNSLLPTGVMVVLSDGSDAPVKAWLVSSGPVVASGEDRISLPAGTRAVVVKDEAVQAPKEPTLRLTRVRLVGGPRDGVEVEVPRYKLRPPG